MNVSMNRRELLQSAVFAGAGLLGRSSLGASSPNEQIGIGIIGLGGRGNLLAGQFGSEPGAKLVAFCDVDRERCEAAAKEHGVDHCSVAYEELLDDPNVDAVVIATCNHWHCLAAIHAIQAGKDVYVEKPLGHDLWQQEQLVAAARQSGRIVQVGTQQRSDPLQAEVRHFLHEEHALGEIHGAIACRLGARASIGQRAEPLSPPKSLDSDRWFGPAEPKPLFRDKFHYDWHWDWDTGDGEMGNWGVHVLDDLRNVALKDAVEMPTAVASVAGRAAWSDAGSTPNVHVSLFETPVIPVACVTNNMPAPQGTPPPKIGGVRAGYVVLCEGGRYEGRRGGGDAYDAFGKLIRKFDGDAGVGHCRNFLNAVRQRDASLLNAPVEVGHASSAWCHYANASCLSGVPSTPEHTANLAKREVPWRYTLEMTQKWMQACGLSIDKAPFVVGGWQSIDRESQRFTVATQGAQRVFRPNYRNAYRIPKITST